MLSEEKRVQLDGIVSKMIQNNESDETIQFVVNDFKERYKNEAPLVQEQTSGSKLGNFATGIAQSVARPLQNIGKAVFKGFEKVTGIKSPTGIPEELLTPQTTAQKTGKTIGDIAQFAIPGSKVARATEGLPFLARVLSRAGTAGAVATAQEGKVGTGTGFAVGTEVTLPVAGKIIKPVLSIGKRLVKSLASGLSGVSSKAIDAIIAEPSTARNVAKNIDISGSTDTIKKNAEIIINGVSRVRQEARSRFGQAIGELKSEDINPKLFRDSISKVLNEIGSVIKNGVRKLTKAEFSEQRNIKTANKLIDELSKTKLDGYSLRQLLHKIDNSAYKIATTDERLSFNAFIRDLSDGVKNAINESTNKLKDINKAYSTDLQLTSAIEGIFGKVKFKNLDELRRVSEKLDSLFAKKGLSPEIIDDFLNRIGVSPTEFRATEAVRRISDIGAKSNTEGLSFAEIMRAVTSSVITPKAIRNASILTGFGEDVLTPLFQRLDPIARGALIELLTQSNENASNTTVNPPQ